MSDDSYDPTAGYTPVKNFDLQTGELKKNSVIIDTVPNDSIFLRRPGIAIIFIIYMLLAGGVIAFCLYQYYMATNWITANSYRDVIFYVTIPLPLFTIGFILSMVKLIKPAIGVFIVSLVLSVLTLNLPTAFFIGICLILCFQLNKRKKEGLKI